MISTDLQNLHRHLMGQLTGDGLTLDLRQAQGLLITLQVMQLATAALEQAVVPQGQRGAVAPQVMWGVPAQGPGGVPVTPPVPSPAAVIDLAAQRARRHRPKVFPGRAPA